MANTSASGGYLLPTTAPPAQGLALGKVFQAIVAALTGLPGSLVRPDVAENDPLTGKPGTPTPNVGVDWCAVGVKAIPSTQIPAQIHNSAGDGSTLLQGFDLLEVTASFFGPTSDGNARMLRDLLYVSQNREAMRRAGLEYQGHVSLIEVPDIPAAGTRRRSDLKLHFYQTVERTLPILNLLEAQGTVHADGDSVSGAGEITTPFDTKDA